MPKRALLALALPLLLGSCAPLGSLLSSLDSGEASPRRVGPIFVGQIWTVSGRVEGRDLSTSLIVSDLRDVPDGIASVGLREQQDALSRGQADFRVVTYRPDPRRLTFLWVGEPGTTYTCQIDNVLGAELRGTLKLDRENGADSTGTCQAVPNQP